MGGVFVHADITRIGQRVSPDQGFSITILRHHRQDDVLRQLPESHLQRVAQALFTPSTAAGSKPQWTMQCSQRGSLPRPSLSQSVSCTRSSYVLWCVSVIR